MSRTSSLFLFLLLLLVLLLYIYQISTITTGVTRIPPKHQSLHENLVKVAAGVYMESVGSSVSISNYDSVDSSSQISSNSTGDDGPVHVIVLARMRTGSTLCGEILNQNPELYFIFEPLHALKALLASSVVTDKERHMLSSDLLKKLYNCNFPRTFIQSFARWGIGKGKSSGLLPICQKTDGCRNAAPYQFTNRCKSFGHVATKTIRADIKMMKPLIKKHNINLKVIHLMRDPRGTASSRKSYYMQRSGGLQVNIQNSPSKSLQDLGLLSATSTKNHIPQLCDWMKETLNIALQKPPWLKDHYKLVRYEDLARAPMRLSQDIYNFLGLDMPMQVMNWIKKNTESGDPDSKIFSTHRNSSQVYMSWREKLSLKEVAAVQDICGDVMDALGYRKVYSEDDLTDSSISLVESINLGDDIMIT